MSHDGLDPLPGTVPGSVPGAPPLPPPPPPLPHPRSEGEFDGGVDELVDEIDEGIVDPARLTAAQEEILADAPGPDEAGDEPIVEEIETLHLKWWQWVALWLSPVLVLGLVGGAATVYAGSPAVPAIDALYPHEIGTRWVYQETENGKDVGEVTQQITGHAMLGRDPADVVSEHFADIGGSAFDQLLYLGRDAHQIYEYGTRSSNGYQVFTPRLPQIAPQHAGGKISWTGTEGTDATTSTTTYVGTEHVSEAGRSYDGCVHESTTTGGGRPGNTYTDVTDTWACPGYGNVRSREVYVGGSTRIEIDLALVAFTAPEHAFSSTPSEKQSADEGPTEGSSGNDKKPASEEGRTLETGRANAVDGTLDPRARRWTETMRGDPAFPPVFTGHTSIASFLDGRVVATDTQTGVRTWQVAVAGPPPAAPVAEDGVVLLSGGDKALSALDAVTGAVKWTVRLPDVPSTAPAIVGETVVVAAQDDSTYGLRASDGRLLWHEAGEFPVVTPMVPLDKETVASVNEHGEVAVREAATGEEKWARSLDNTFTGGLALRDGQLVAADTTGAVWAFDAETGRVNWWHIFPNVVSQPVAYAAHQLVMVIGPKHVVAVDPASGHQLWTRTMPDDVAAQPAVVGDAVAVVDDRARLHVLDLRDGSEATDTALLHGDVGVVQPRELGYVEDARGPSIVVPLRMTVPSSLIEIAIPVKGEEPENESLPGVEFDVDRVSAPATPYWNIALGGASVHDGYAFSTGTGAVMYVSPTGTPMGLIAAGKKAVPGVLLDHGVVYAQSDKALVAIDAASHKQLWTFPMQDPYPDVTPAIDGDLVVVPEHGAGMVAVAAKTGRPRWIVTSDVFDQPAGGSPYILPDGDVLYAGGGLFRVDGKTGVKRWHVAGVQTFGPITADGQNVYIDAFVNGMPKLLAVDLATGTQRWEQQVSLQALQGPAAGGGVVATVDDKNVVHAYAADDGHELWQRQLGGALAGDVVISGGRLVADVEGREEDVQQNDHRVVVWDAQDGAFLGAWQATASGFTKTAFGQAPDGSFLVPDGFLTPYTIDIVRLVAQ